MVFEKKKSFLLRKLKCFLARKKKTASEEKKNGYPDRRINVVARTFTTE